VWETGGCSRWYRDKSGKITTQWPGFTFRFRRQTRTFDLNAYHAVCAHDLTAATENDAASA
jgi:cyclohexanone monooxygenase